MPDDKTQPETEAPKGKKHAPTEPSKVLCHVSGPGGVFYGGRSYAAGDEFEAPPDDVAAMGDLVRRGPAPKPDAPIGERAAGRYVVGPGSVWSAGKMLPAGTEITLDEAEARRLGDAVRELR